MTNDPQLSFCPATPSPELHEIADRVFSVSDVFPPSFTHHYLIVKKEGGRPRVTRAMGVAPRVMRGRAPPRRRKWSTGGRFFGTRVLSHYFPKLARHRSKLRVRDAFNAS